jgi:bifunctional DNA-binding transcriptional regulator/antitoxin component of YhaV-PrlF toxin-antitoxin module
MLPISPIKVNEMRKEVAIISVVRNGRITIPEELRKELGIIDGTKIKVELDIESGRKSVVLTKM